MELQEYRPSHADAASAQPLINKSLPLKPLTDSAAQTAADHADRIKNSLIKGSTGAEVFLNYSNVIQKLQDRRVLEGDQVPLFSHAILEHLRDYQEEYQAATHGHYLVASGAALVSAHGLATGLMNWSDLSKELYATFNAKKVMLSYSSGMLESVAGSIATMLHLDRASYGKAAVGSIFAAHGLATSVLNGKELFHSAALSQTTDLVRGMLSESTGLVEGAAGIFVTVSRISQGRNTQQIANRLLEAVRHLEDIS